MIYSSMEQSGVAILANKKWQQKTKYSDWISTRIATVRLKMERGKLTIFYTHGRKGEV